jgi:hypothetical protein
MILDPRLVLAQGSAIPSGAPMKRLYYWLAVAFFVVVPPRFCYVLYRDLNHPETWWDWQRNPYVYLPMLAVVILVGIVLGGHILLTEVRERRERKSNNHR